MSSRSLIISETDGCFVDGNIAVTGCTVGYHTPLETFYGVSAESILAITFLVESSGLEF